MQQEKALPTAQSGTGPNINFEGTWKNEINSTMVLTQDKDTISGEYESAVSDDGTSTKGKLVGYVDGDLVGFAVHWYEFQAITTWVGQLVPRSKPIKLKTLWQMTKQVDDGKEWASINTGSDTFTLQP